MRIVLCTMPQCQTMAGCVCDVARIPIGGSVTIKRIDDEKVQEIMAEIGVRFRTFGGGIVGNADNPLSHALKDKPLQFAAGVDVREVIRLVLALA